MTVTSLFADTDSRPSAPNPVAAAFDAAARAVAAWRAERARELALHDLLNLEPHRLSDLGITAYDVRQVIESARHR